MFCPTCGKQLPDETKFCGGCGTNIAEFIASQTKDVMPEAIPPVATAVTEDVTLEEIPAIPETESEDTAPTAKPKKKSKKGCIIGGVLMAVVAIIAAIAVLLVAVLGVGGGLLLFGNWGKQSPSYVYMSNGTYKLVTDIDKSDVVEFGSAPLGNTYYMGLPSFSPDSKYLYYFSDFSTLSGFGSLYRTQCNKLEPNNIHNIEHLQWISDNVSQFRFVGDNHIVYTTENGGLHYFDGEVSTKLTDNLYHLLVIDDTHIAYAEKGIDEQYKAYGVATDDLSEKILLSQGDIPVYANGPEEIFVISYDDSYTVDLYVTGFTREDELLGHGASIYALDEDGICFDAENGETLNPLDYITDTHKKEDAAAVMPEIADFRIPAYTYSMISGNNLKESDYKELYTSCTQKLYWLGGSRYFSYSMEDALDVTWSKNNDKIHAALQSFIDKYGDKANEDGFIKITPEIKKDLLALQTLADDPSKTWQWMWLCYERYQDGNTTDYDAYAQAMSIYEQAENRNNMREELSEKDNQIQLHTLYRYADGVKTPIAENTVDSRYFNNAVIYTTSDMVRSDADLSEFTDSSDIVYALGAVDNAAQQHVYVFDSDATLRFSADSTQEDANNFSYYSDYIFTDTEVYYHESDTYELMIASVENGEIGAFKPMVKDVCRVMYEDNVLYYYVTLPNDTERCDLYCYENGDSTLIAANLSNMTVLSYDDGLKAGLTAQDTLTLIDADGNTTELGNNVTEYARINKSTWLYIADNELYMYNGKESTCIDSNVEHLCVSEEMEYTVIG